MSVALGQGIGGLEVVEGQSIGGLGVHGEPPLNAGLDWDWQPHAKAAAIPAPWPTPVRAGTSWALDHDGVLKTLEAGEMPRPGHRRISNVAASSSLASGYTFTNCTNDGAVTVNGIAGRTVTLTAGSHALFQTSFTNSPGRRINVSFYAQSTSGTVATNLNIFDGTHHSTAINIATTLQRFSKSYTVSTGASSTIVFLIDGRNIDGGGQAGSTSGTVNIVGLQIEFTEGASVNAPGEFAATATTYPDSGVLGVRYSNYTNGNTVDGNGVVTEAQGTLIPAATRRGVRLNPARTNFIRRSYDLTNNASWVESGAGTEALDAVGIDGAANKATTLADTDASGFTRWQASPTLSASGVTHVTSVWVEKNPSATWVCEVHLLGALASADIFFQLDPTDGASFLRSGSPVFTAVEDGGDWWIMRIGHTPTATSGGNLRIFPAVATSLGSSVSSSVTGSIVVGHVQTEQGAFATSPIPTNGSEVTRLADDLTAVTIPDEATYAVEFVAQQLTGAASDRVILGADGDRRLYLDNATLKLTNGTQTLSATGTVVAGQVHKVLITDTGSAMSVRLDGNAEATSANGWASAAAVLQVGADGNILKQPGIDFRRVRGWRRILTAAEKDQVLAA